MSGNEIIRGRGNVFHDLGHPDADREQLRALPETLAERVARAATLRADGHKVSVLADDETLTIRAAAERLNVSSQCMVRLVDQGALPSVKVGSHRRLRASDVAAYKRGRDAKRDAALDRLAALSEDAGGYQLGD